jgi:transcriptional regulator with XRE-family HTH domain
MKIESNLNDELILTEMGRRLARLRLEAGLTQARLAEQAGVAKRTLERVEAGESIQLLTLIRLLRVLGLLDGLDSIVPSTQASPMNLLKQAEKEAAASHSRQRASAKKDVAREQPWSWGDEQ